MKRDQQNRTDGSSRTGEDTESIERREGTERRAEQQPVTEERRTEVRRTEDRPRRDAGEQRRHLMARVTQGVDYLFYLLYGLLVIRFMLTLLGGSEQAGFVRFINGLTDPFYDPFGGIVTRPAVNGGVLDFPLMIAVLAYALLHIAIRGLLRLLAGPRPA